MKNKKTFLYTLAVVAGGLLLALLSIYLEYRSVAAYEAKWPYVALGEWVKADAEQTHARFGTYLNAGGVSMSEDVVKPLQKSRGIVQSAFEGGSNELGAFGAFQDEEVAVLLRGTALELDVWLDAAQQIHTLKQGGNEEGVNELRQQAEASYLKLQASMGSLATLAQQRINREQSLLQRLFWVSIGLLVSLFSVLSYRYFRLLRRSEKVEEETQQKLERDEARMTQLTDFIEAVSNGNYEVQLASDNGQDHVTNTLVQMRAKLKDNALLEQRRNWATSGQAQIGEILRNTANATELFDQIVKFIVKYTRSNQGGLFILNDEDENSTYLELASCYAFERKKYLTKKVEVGNGLVGQCFLEREKIHLTEVPENYVNITSGLGGTTPRSILVVPLKNNDIVLGVLELASFQHYEPHEVELVEKFAESVAATVSGVKVNTRTRELLEQTQQQAEEMKAQEEEMRQNMEELSATQEELQRQMRESELAKKQLEQRDMAFGLTTILSESDPFGTITFANDKLTQVSKYSREELIGKGHNIFRHPDMPKELFALMWDTIRQGQVFQGIIKNRAKDGTHYWVDATIMPVTNEEGKIVKYIGARYHIESDELAENLYEKQVRRLGLPSFANAS